MSNLSDFPQDVQAAAAEAVPEWAYADNRVVAVQHIVATAIMADRAGRLDTTGLTTKQAECLKAIADHQAQHGVSPSFEELATALGLASRSGVLRLLMALEKRGRILRPANRSRAITIIANPAT
jgi:DNA-binding MarR family transcriptional regulator